MSVAALLVTNMAHVDISTTAIQTLLSRVPNDFLRTAPATNLPIALPLSYPSPLHELNTLVTLHLVHSVLELHPAYFAGLSSAECATRGTIALYLASDAAWDKSNLLSQAAWASGELEKIRVAEMFGVEVMTEREHPTMPGIRVGEAHQAAVKVVQALVDLFNGLGQKLTGRCVGEEVQGLLERAAQGVDSGDAGVYQMVRSFCERVGAAYDPADDRP